MSLDPPTRQTKCPNSLPISQCSQLKMLTFTLLLQRFLHKMPTFPLFWQHYTKYPYKKCPYTKCPYTKCPITYKSMMSRQFALSSELGGAIAKRIRHAKNQLSAPGSFFNQFVTEIYIYIYIYTQTNKH